MKNLNFIAEIGVNHEGKLKNALKHVRAAKDGGAQSVKFQVYKAEKIVSQHAKSYWDKKAEKETSQLKLYRRFDGLTLKDYQKIYIFCKKIKIKFIITPFDLDSVNFFKNKVDYFKISSSDITNYPLIEKISRAKKPIILSTGASTYKEVGSALKIIEKRNKKITLLHCILNYPTNKDDANLNMIDDLKNFGYPVGISDHTKPIESHEVLPMAYIKGVRVFEKHFTLNKRKKGNDHFHSFDKKDLKGFFHKVNEIEKILGMNNKTFLKSEIISRKNARRSIFLNKSLSKGDVIKPNDLITLRPNLTNGISAIFFNKIIGKKIKKNKKKGDFLKQSDV